MTLVTGTGVAVSGLGGPAGYGEIMLTQADDASLQVSVGAVFENGFQFGGQTYGANNVFVSTNGLISFGSAINGVETNLANLAQPFIAAFHADVDTRLDGEGPESGPVWVDIDPVSDVVTITWQDVGFYRRNADATNLFQLQLYDQGADGFDIVLRYEEIGWTTGDLQGGWGGLGGDAAQIGYRLAPTGTPVLLGASGIGSALLNLPVTLGNTGVAGLWVYRIGGPGLVSGLINGGAAADLLVGSAQNDQIYGGAGDDTLRGLAGPDILDGGAGTDWVDYSLATVGVTVSLSDPATNSGEATGDSFISVEALIGSAHADSLSGDSGDNTLAGGAGNDTLHGGAGADSLDGGAGVDLADYSAAASAVKAYLSASYLNTGEAAGDRYSGIEGIIGSAFADTLLGSNSGDLLFGGVGADVLYGRGGDDSLFGGLGDDVLDGASGADALDGGAGTDVASYETATSAVLADLLNPSANTGDAAQGDSYTQIEGLTGTRYGDSLNGDDYSNTLTGQFGNDVLDGRAGNDTLFGSYDNDTLIGGGGADFLSGGSGFDWIDYSTASALVMVSLTSPTSNTGDAAGDSYSSIEGLIGSAFADRLSGNAVANILYGGDGNDRLLGGSGNDQLFGGAGADLLDGGFGADHMDGGPGFDTAVYSLANAGVTVDLTGGFTDTGTIANGDTFHQVEGLIGSIHNDQLYGDAQNNSIDGRAGNNYLSGRAGNDTLLAGAQNDTLNGGTGADQLFGGDGFDWADYSQSATAVIVSLTGPASNIGEAAGDVYDSIEALIGSAFADRLSGNTGANALDGGGGDDSIYAGSGDDTLIGGAGADLLDGGAGHDLASYATAATGIVARLAGTGSTSGDAAGDTYLLIEGLIGSNHSDQLYGSASGDWLYGGSGNDTLIGGAGADVLQGGDGFDFVSYVDADAALRIDLINTTTNTGEAAGDSYSSIEAVTGSLFSDQIYGNSADNFLDGSNGNDQLYGQAGNDTLWGGAGADSLNGGTGNDILRGAKGSDWLTGGAGADTFYLVGTDDTGDIVLDYQPTQGDVLSLGGVGFVRSQFSVSFANVAGVGSSSINDARVTHTPTGVVFWTIADCAALTDLILLIGTTSYDLL